MENLASFPNVDLFSAGVNALYGVLLARSATHNRGYTVAGLLVMAFFGGIGGGLTRDILLNEIPAPLKDVKFLIACLLMGILGLAIDHYAASKGEAFRKGTLHYFKAFTLPWFAIVGAHKALDHDLGIFAALLIGLIATTAGGVLIDLFSGLTPEVVEPAEHLVTTALLAAAVYVALLNLGMPFLFSTLLAVLVAFVFRLFAVGRRWEEIVPRTATVPAGSITRSGTGGAGTQPT